MPSYISNQTAICLAFPYHPCMVYLSKFTIVFAKNKQMQVYIYHTWMTYIYICIISFPPASSGFSGAERDGHETRGHRLTALPQGTGA